MEESEIPYRHKDWKCIICGKPCLSFDVICGKEECNQKRLEELRILSERFNQAEEDRRNQPVTVGMMEDYIKEKFNLKD